MPNINELLSRPGSERGILSIVLANHDKILECEEQNLFSEHFAVNAHQYIYSAICYLYANQNVNRIDSMLLYNTIQDPEAKRALDEIGGMRYIDSLIQSRVHDNLRFYIKDVRNMAIRRMAYNMGKEIQDIVLRDENRNIEEILNEIQANAITLSLSTESESEIYRMGEETEEVLRQRAEQPTEIAGYAMGWKRYDKITQGQKPNELTVFVAESKAGKSVLLLNHAKKFSIDDGIPGLYIDTEMTSREQEDRLLAMISGVPIDEIINGMFIRDTIYGTGREKMRKLNEALAKIRQAPLYHIYLPNFTIEKVSALVRKYQIQYNVGYVIFDYIKLPTSEINGLATAQEYQRLGYITTCLKDLAGICSVPVLTAAQANRTIIDNEDPDANQLGGSYRILQMASRLVFLVIKSEQTIMFENNTLGNRKLIVKYQRNGIGDSSPIHINFDQPISRMTEVSI